MVLSYSRTSRNRTLDRTTTPAGEEYATQCTGVTEGECATQGVHGRGGKGLRNGMRVGGTVVLSDSRSSRDRTLDRTTTPAGEEGATQCTGATEGECATQGSHGRDGRGTGDYSLRPGGRAGRANTRTDRIAPRRVVLSYLRSSRDRILDRTTTQGARECDGRGDGRNAAHGA